MKDLDESARLFEASARLQSASTALAKVQKSEPLTQEDRDSLIWAGGFLSEMDFITNPGSSGGLSGGLSVQATDVRPSFYTTLLNCEPVFRNAGLGNDSDLHTFLTATYESLRAGGIFNSLENDDWLGLARVLLEQLAKALLVRLTGNGVSFESEFSSLLVA